MAFDLLDEVGEVAAPEGEMADDQCVDDDPDRPHVPGLADFAAVCLGGHEGRRPSGVDHDVGGVVDDGVGDTKVADLNNPVVPEEEVGGLEVLVDDALQVQEVEPG